MTLSPGAKLGPYEITAKLGEGGMGQVFRAVDQRLGRQVAIKILPDKVARDPEHLALFEREARLLASLNHPNVAAIYGLEEGEGVRALVLELVEGPTLADRLEEGALSLAESLEAARQIAEALGEAHEKGIVHRDLKPGNVKCPEGRRVKVLDFGLAKAYRESVSMVPDIDAHSSGMRGIISSCKALSRIASITCCWRLAREKSPPELCRVLA